MQWQMQVSQLMHAVQLCFISYFPVLFVGTVPTPVELFRQRSTNHDIAEYIKQQLPYHDAYDSLLYERALKIFQEEVEYVQHWRGIRV